MMIGLGGACQKAAVNGGVQGLHAAAQNFGRAGIIGDFGHGQAMVMQQACRAARGN